MGSNIYRGGRLNLSKKMVESLPPSQRESVGIAIHLYNRLYSLTKNNDCRRCWLQAAHCICPSTPPLENEDDHDCHNDGRDGDSGGAIPYINRLFLLTHHKEIGMAVDTAKLILGCFPVSCRLVIGGLDGEFQRSMVELDDAMQQKDRKCMVLFPSDGALTYSELIKNLQSFQAKEKEEEEV